MKKLNKINIFSEKINSKGKNKNEITNIKFR